MYLRVSVCGITGLLAILVGACAPDNVTCTSKETIESVKRTALDMVKRREEYADVDASRSTADVLDIKQRLPDLTSCSATLSQHLRFTARGDKPKPEDKNFSIPIVYYFKAFAKDVEATIYGPIVPPDICAFLARYTKDPQGWRGERVSQQTTAFTVKHKPSGMSCGGSDLYKDLPSISCGSLPKDPYFILPSTWEMLDKEAAACLSADKFDKVRDESRDKEWSKRYDASLELRVSWKQENDAYTINLQYRSPK